MHKNHIPCIKTGEFATLCGTNKRTLIHYDEIGLFSPAYTNELGYRFYSEEQCDVFNTIICLKEIGMPLKKIKEYLQHRSPEELQKLLTQQHDIIQAEIEHLRRIDLVIQTKKDLVTLGSAIRPGHILLEECEEEYLILSQQVNSSEHDVIIPILYNHLAFCNARKLNTGHPYGAMIDQKHLEAGAFDTYAYFFTKIAAPVARQNCFQKEAGRYVTTYLKGNYYDVKDTYRRMINYIEETGLVMVDYSYKEGIVDEVAVKRAEDFLTKISIRVK